MLSVNNFNSTNKAIRNRAQSTFSLLPFFTTQNTTQLSDVHNTAELSISSVIPGSWKASRCGCSLSLGFRGSVLLCQGAVAVRPSHTRFVFSCFRWILFGLHLAPSKFQFKEKKRQSDRLHFSQCTVVFTWRCRIMPFSLTPLLLYLVISIFLGSPLSHGLVPDSDIDPDQISFIFNPLYTLNKFMLQPTAEVREYHWSFFLADALALCLNVFE